MDQTNTIPDKIRQVQPQNIKFFILIVHLLKTNSAECILIVIGYKK